MALEFISSQEMRALEAQAIESGLVSGLALMELAGQGVVEAIFQQWKDLKDKETHAIVLCGPGNNGGDGFVVARLLRACQISVDLFFYGNAADLPPDARTNFDRWHALVPHRSETLTFPDVTPLEVQKFADAISLADRKTLVVDALFGIGLSRPLIGVTALFDVLKNAKKAEPERLRCVSVDVPSGLAEHGLVCEDPPAVFPADLTVTFHRLKSAHRSGARFCGRIAICDIGLDGSPLDGKDR